MIDVARLKGSRSRTRAFEAEREVQPSDMEREVSFERCGAEALAEREGEREGASRASVALKASRASDVEREAFALARRPHPEDAAGDQSRERDFRLLRANELSPRTTPPPFSVECELK